MSLGAIGLRIVDGQRHLIKAHVVVLIAVGRIPSCSVVVALSVIVVVIVNLGHRINTWVHITMADEIGLQELPAKTIDSVVWIFKPCF